MNRAWATSIENLWHSQNLPMWLTVAAAGFFCGRFAGHAVSR
jgi:hypothetical protein